MNGKLLTLVLPFVWQTCVVHSPLCLRIRIDIKKTGDIRWQPESGIGVCRRCGGRSVGNWRFRARLDCLDVVIEVDVKWVRVRYCFRKGSVCFGKC
jgi:hypothetical protein